MDLIQEKKILSNADYFQVAEGVWGMRMLFVNIYMIENKITNEWVLVDAGLLSFEGSIVKMAEEIFGEGTKPAAIVLTHGHFDHTGAIEELLNHWDVPVYAHNMELPYLNGQSSYPPADPTAGGGLMAWMSWMYPTSSIDISRYLQELSDDKKPDVLNNWQIIHTPGHTPGHISLFRDTDKLLISGDAFVTTKSESLFSIIKQEKKVCGPPNYLTPDWSAAYNSVRKLADLQPEIVASGHGMPIEGEKLKEGLEKLISNFETDAVPEDGRYAGDPAKADERGVYYIPPFKFNQVAKMGLGIAAGLVAGFFLVKMLKK